MITKIVKLHFGKNLLKLNKPNMNIQCINLLCVPTQITEIHFFYRRYFRAK